MEYVKKVSPAIPTLRHHQRHMERQFKTVARGARHGIPDKEADVAKLTAHYIKSNLHVYTKGRKVAQKSQDVMNTGTEDLEGSDTIKKWWGRRSHLRSTLEDWSTGEANNESTEGT
jgi:hypothetical protein